MVPSEKSSKMKNQKKEKTKWKESLAENQRRSRARVGMVKWDARKNTSASVYMHFLRSFIDTKISTSVRRRKCFGSWYPNATIVRTNRSKTRNVDGFVYTGILKRGVGGGKGVGAGAEKNWRASHGYDNERNKRERKKGGGGVRAP